MVEGNRLLEALRTDAIEFFAPSLVTIELATGSVIHEPGDAVRFAWFPRGSAVASYIIPIANGPSVETAMIGREGVLGGIISNGEHPAYARCVVIQPGSFYRVALADLALIKQNYVEVAYLFQRYADCLLSQLFQATACNAAHSIEQRAAKWLCAALGRSGKPTIDLTQEQVATMIGVGRSYASRVLQRFKADGLIRTRRGSLEVLDRPGLAARACTCNDLVERQFRTVLRGIYPDQA